MFCNHCGAELPDNAKFCRYCGSQIAAEAAAPANTNEQAQPVFQQSPQSPEQQNTQQEKVSQTEQTYRQQYENSVELRKPPRTLSAKSGVSGKALLWLLLASFLLLILSFTVFSRRLNSKTYLKESFDGIHKDADLDALTEVITDRADISDNQAKRIIEKAKVTDLLTKYGYQITDCVFGGGKTPHIDSDDVMDTIEKNLDMIEDTINDRILKSDMSKIERNVIEVTDNCNEEIAKIKKDHSALLTLTSVIGSLAVFIVIIVALVLIFTRLFFLYLRDGSGFYRAFRGYAIVFGVIGLICLAIGIAVPIIIEKTDLMNAELQLAAAFISPLIKGMIFAAIIWLAACVVFIVLTVVFRSIFRKKLAASQPAAA